MLTSLMEGIHTVEVGSGGCTWTFAHCPFKILATRAAQLKRAVAENAEGQNRAAADRMWVKQGS